MSSVSPAPTTPHSQSSPASPSPASKSTSSSFFTYPVSYAVSGLIRRLSTEPSASKSSPTPHLAHASTAPSPLEQSASDMQGVFTPPRRYGSPFQPPPLTPLSLSGYASSTREGSRLLSKTLAEEIRLLFPARLQLVEEWHLAYSLEQNGVSLATLYKKCEQYRGKRGGYVLVVKDSSGGIFGAYLSDPPHPSPHFFGNGECFLWRASVLPSIPDLSSLPPPPSEDTTNAQRMTTLAAPKRSKPDALSPPVSGAASRSGTSTPERIRFKAFPYSGINDYMMFCEQGFLSVGGGDGHYGLWLDDSLEKGVSSQCPTFGNEPLSDEGRKFDVLGVELWYVGIS